MKFPFWPIITILALAGSIPLAWWLGRRSGIEDGAKAGAWHGNVNTIAMILSNRALEEQGDPVKARKFLDDALYLNASSLDMNQDSKALTDDNRAAGESLLYQVSDYYWRHPETFDINIEEHNTPQGNPLEAAVSEAMEPLFEVAGDHQRRTRAILLRHKPTTAEQAGTEQPATQSRQAKD
jgi:hypothetical protein